MNCLIVVAHPDDEVLGAGATIYKMVQEGHRVAVAIMSSNAEVRANISDTLQSDMGNALNMLGVEKIYPASFPNIKMNTVPHLELVQFVESCIKDFNAQRIITHYPSETNNDHVVTAYAVQAACRLFQRQQEAAKLCELWFMEVLSSTEWSLDPTANRFSPNCFVEIGKEALNMKIQALREYKGVMRPYPHPRSVEAIEGLAAFRGAQSGCNYAEAFVCAFRRMEHA